MAGSKSDSLNAAGKAKKDEFYTQLTDIEKELKYYRKHFEGKVVFCNCDDPFESNFFKYFVLNFNRLKLKKLICTCYVTSPIAHQQLSLFDIIGDPMIVEETRKPYKAIVTKVYDATGDGSIDMFDVAELFKSGENELSELKGDGDFRSAECIELLKESDIVVTNPPFSLFREYVSQLIEYEKKFVIIGSITAVTYKEIFPLIKENKLFWGVTTNGSNRYFRVPDSYDLTEKTGKIEDGVKYAFVKGVMWYTNLDVKKLHDEMILVKKYDPNYYPQYANYSAIDVANVKEIPYDYSGEMGVPITFLNKYNPEQFEIIGISLELAKPMKKIAEKGTYMQGGNRFYTRNITEKDKETTKSTLDKYADINVKGYDQIEDENGTHNVVAVEVTNKSEETVSIAVDLAAKDNDDKVLDISSLYAEGITPGQTYSFNLFYYTELTADQLKSAKYDVYKAYIYTAPTAEGEEAETITIEEGTEE